MSTVMVNRKIPLIYVQCLQHVKQITLKEGAAAEELEKYDTARESI